MQITPLRHGATYRARAEHLRTLAQQMRSTAAMRLERHAGVDTWRGPGADRCCGDLAAAQRTVRGAADDLDRQAWRFDEIAHGLDAAALAAERRAEAEGGDVG